MLKLRVLYVNHENETYAILSCAQALNLIACCDCDMNSFGDHTSQTVELEFGQVEIYRNNELVEFSDFNDRVKELVLSFYEDITCDFSKIEDDVIL